MARGRATSDVRENLVVGNATLDWYVTLRWYSIMRVCCMLPDMDELRRLLFTPLADSGGECRAIRVYNRTRHPLSLTVN